MGAAAPDVVEAGIQRRRDLDKRREGRRMLDIETEAICGTKQTAVVRFALAPPRAVVRAESSA